MRLRCAGLWVVALTGASVALAAEPTAPLTLGASREVALAGAATATFELQTDGPGLLSCITRGRGGSLTLELCDPDNQEVPGATSDCGPDDPLCNQLLVVPLPYADGWRLRLTNTSAEPTRVQLAVGWLPFAALAQPAVPHGRPSQASEAELGRTYDGTLEPKRGVVRQWYVVKPPSDGRLSVFTRGDSKLDLALRVVSGAKFETLVADADEDNDGLGASEGLVTQVKAGQSYYLRVEAQAGSSGAYHLGTSFAPF